MAANNSNVLLVQGMAGAGKSTLLQHLGWWWQRTGLVDQVFRFSYEDRTWTVGQIIREIRSRLLSPAEHARADATMSETAQAEQVSQLLRATRHLLILDNTESVTATPAAIPHALDKTEQQKFKDLLAKLRGGKTLVLLGSREAEAWLGTVTAGPGTYRLPGLDPQAVSVLVDRILARHDATGYLTDSPEREALHELVTLLDGYPLPLTVVLPVLASEKPSAVLAELKAGGEIADPAGLIHRAVEYSHGKLDPALQDSLLLLAPFTAVIPVGPFLDAYSDLLAQDQAVQVLGAIHLATALNQAITVGLAAPHPQLRPIVQVQPVLPWFLRTRLTAYPSLHAATAQAHYELYTQISRELHHMLTSPDNSQRRATGRAVTRAEYANLTAALTYALRTRQAVASLVQVLSEYLDQAGQHEARRHLIDEVISASPETEDHSLLAMLHDLAGHTALAQHRSNDARTHYQVERQLHHYAGNRLAEGGVYHQLGMVARQQRQFDEALASYQKALDIFLELGDRGGAARAYHELGTVAHSQHQFDEARAGYQEALDIFLELGDTRSAARVYHDIGTVAHEQRQFDEARASYQKALEIKLEFDDRRSAASTYYQLGRVAFEQERLAEAQTNCLKALDIFIEMDDRFETADVYVQLAAVALTQQRYTEANASCQKALEIYLEFGNRHHAATTYHNLASVALKQQSPAEAEANYRTALDIHLELGDLQYAADIYYKIGKLMEVQQRYEDAEASYEKALDIYRGSDPRLAAIAAAQFGNVLAKLGQHVEAVRTLLYAGVTWHQEAGHWPSEVLEWLHRESVIIEPGEFTALIKAQVPAALVDELMAVIELFGLREHRGPGTDRPEEDSEG